MAVTPPPKDRPDPGRSAGDRSGDRPADTPDSSTADEPTRISENGPGPSVDREVVPLGPSIEGYVLKEEVHRGGQGIVYRAVQLGTKRQVALKVLLEGPFASETTRRRFEREIELAASLRHPNIVVILDTGISFGRYYFAMEYIHGVRLDRYLAKRRCDVEETLRLFEKVCRVINFAHQRGVIHRDLKPPNVLVDEDGEPHVLDFGLAKTLRAPEGSDSTVRVLSTSGQLLGTVAYMSPEQAAGQQDVDVRSDVYSLGVIFYEALVGQPPYPVSGPLGEVLNQIATAAPANPRTLGRRCPSGTRIDDELATILLKALEKEPQRRYQTAGDLARDIRHRLEGHPIEAKRASGLYMLKKTLRRYRLQAATAGLILLMLVGFLVTFAVLFKSEREARRRTLVKTGEAKLAIMRQNKALQEARDRTAEALYAQQRLRGALIRQHIQRGDLALARSDLNEARDSYWSALEIAPGPAALWALRRYYLQTGDNGAALLAIDSHGPTELSPNGQIAAVCSGPRSICVRQVDGGRVLGWVCTPGPVTHLDLRDDATLAAAGPRWARAWQPGTLRPSVSVQLPADARPHALYAVDRGQGLLLVDQREVRLFRGPVGATTQRTALRGRPTGPTDYAPQVRQLAVPTSAGVELISLAEDRLESDLAWSGSSSPPRAVRFDGEDLLAVLADAVYVANVAGPGRGQWTPFVAAAADWELFDLKSGLGMIAFGTRDGELALYRSGELLGTWRCTLDRLEHLRLSSSDRAVVTVDERGTVTRWIGPERHTEHRQIHSTPPTSWATSTDGSTVLMAAADGRVVAHLPGRTHMPQTVLRPRLLGRLPGLADETLSLALSASGERGVIREGTSLRFLDFAEGRAREQPWEHPRLTTPEQVAVSGDGELVALLVRSSTGGRQRIAFMRWPPLADKTPETTHPLPPLEPFDFVGAVIREMAFVPRTHNVLVARSNGQLFLLDPHDSRRPPPIAPTMGQAATLEPWMQIDSPAALIAFNRTGDYLAVACEDHVVRLIAPGRRELRHRIQVGHEVGALAFNPRDDILMVRTADGTVRLFDPATADSITEWRLPAAAERPLASWVGDADGMLLGYDGAVYEHRYEHADALIERNRAYARQRQIARHRANDDGPAAWKEAAKLAETDPALGRYMQVTMLEADLRRPNVKISLDRADTVLADAPARTYIRLGHAAYDGERFDLAGQWLARGREMAQGEVDALTLWGIAECDYLAGAYQDAEARLAAVLAQPDFNPALAPTVALQRVAALVLAKRPAAARRAATRIGRPDPWGRYGDIVAITSARLIGRFITGLEDENLMSAGLNRLLAVFAERSLLFGDDVYFFSGELARERGDRAQAAVQYQRCIDVSRDPWPANWSRWRLTQLARTPG